MVRLSGRARGVNLSRRLGTAALLVVVVTLAFGAGGAGAQGPPDAASPSDDRATFVAGNVTTCAGAGFGASVQVGGQGNSSASDANVAGTVAVNAGTVNPGQGEELNVTITGSDVVIDAVIVKGGNAYNLYSNPAVLPPALVAPQHYISPFTGGGTIPQVSHWLICYHTTTPPPAGSLSLDKVVVAPNGVPVTPLPMSYTVVVNCDDGNPDHQNVMVTFPAAGGQPPVTPTLTGIPPDTVCTVVEQDTGTFPTGTVVSYDPPGADDPGVTIGADEAVRVRVVNDFSDIEVQTAQVEVTKLLTDVPGADPPPATFTARLQCSDGTDTQITLPGIGGAGTPPMVSVDVGAQCAIAEEPSSVPAGWTVSYSVDGGPATTTPPTFDVVDQTTVAVIITNDPPATTTTSTSTSSTTSSTSTTSTTSTTGPPTTGSPTVAPNTAPPTTIGPQIPNTGTTTAPLVMLASAALLAGVILLAARRLTS